MSKSQHWGFSYFGIVETRKARTGLISGGAYNLMLFFFVLFKVRWAFNRGLINGRGRGGGEGTYKQQFTVFIYLPTETFFLSVFTSLNVSSYNIFTPRKKWVGCLWRPASELSCNRCSCSLFSSLYTLIFFACNKNASSNNEKT